MVGTQDLILTVRNKKEVYNIYPNDFTCLFAPQCQNIYKCRNNMFLQCMLRFQNI